LRLFVRHLREDGCDAGLIETISMEIMWLRAKGREPVIASEARQSSAA
jgi:hypothetical protein